MAAISTPAGHMLIVAADQRNGMKADFSWTNSGKAYAELYRELTDKP